MAIFNDVASVKKVSGILVAICLLFLASPGLAQQVDKVTTYQDENGWKLQVDGKDFYVKGVVWGYAPPGTNYSYSIWNQPEELIKTVIDREFSLMKAANINAIRTFATIPPRWVTYIYEQYGIMSVVNPLMGRYGASIDGVWRPTTDYSDPRTREVLKAEVLAEVEKFKDTKGVLMFALGNESNYGLSWSASFEIENLPVGESQREKAKFLYSLFDEVIDASKEIAPDHLFTIVNGDIQYLDLIVEYGSDWDMLGINSYRGISFTDLWARVDKELDLPVIFFEFGSDAYNARDLREDQGGQANYLRGQWQEMYNKSYNHGEEGNAIGGFVFEWRDEWWKYKQTENLDIQDNTASWGNGGYKFDFVEGQNNMNEEWFGITKIGTRDNSGYYESVPRIGYDVLKSIWTIDPYRMSKDEMNSKIRDMNMDYYKLKSEVRSLKSSQQKSENFRLVGGSLKAEFLVKGEEQEIDVDGEDGLRFSDGQMLNLDFEFEHSKIKGDFSINMLANVADSDFEFRYGDRGEPYTVATVEDDSIVLRPKEINGNERIELYDFQASYAGDNFDLTAFYHVPRYHWMHEGDFFGLLRETTDLTGANGQDIWNAKAPYGVEYSSESNSDSLKVVFGPEIYWGANPKAIVKYEFATESVDYALMLAEEIAEREESASATEATVDQTRQATIYAKTHISDSVKMELGGIFASNEKVGDAYDRLEGDDVVVDEIENKDTLGIKGKFTFDVNNSTEAYVGFNYAGLVADGGATLTEWGTQLPYSELGNKKEIDGGVRFTTGDYTIYPRFLVRENIVDANPKIEPTFTGTTLTNPGLSPRNRDDDPFAVLDNREAESLEIYFTYDPTPSSWFYDWNVDMTEDAAFAFNVGLTATSYDTATDDNLYFNEEIGRNASFGEGLPDEDVWLLKSKMVFNPRSGLRYVLNLTAGKQQSTGQVRDVNDNSILDAIEFYAIDGKAVIDNTHIWSGYIKVDDFGLYDFQRQFNIVYPLQLKLEYTRLLDKFKDEDASSKWGVKGLYRELDELSGDPYEEGENEHMFEIQTYYEVKF